MADRLFPTDILDSCFPRGSLPPTPTPTPPVGAEPRTHASIDNDDRVACHSINRTKTNNVRHACELWTESFSPPPPRPRVVIRLRLWARAEGRAGFLFPLPSNVVSRCKRERISSRDGRIMEEKERGEGAISSVRLHSRTRSFSRAFYTSVTRDGMNYSRGNYVNLVDENKMDFYEWFRWNWSSMNFLWILMDSEALDFLDGFFWLKLIIDEFSNFRAILI